MSVSAALFYSYGLITLAGAVGVLAARRPAHAVLSLFVSMIGVAALFMLMGSQFLAALQLFVYGGAITVLALFVLMLSKPSIERVASPSSAGYFAATLAAIALFAVIVTAIVVSPVPRGAGELAGAAPLAELLFTRYLLPFEIAGLLLTIALVGAIVLVRSRQVPAGTEPRQGATPGGEQP